MSGHAASLLTIFGATGDLAQRMLLPSLYGLEADRLLPPRLRILGSARSAMDADAFRALVAQCIEQRVPTAERNEATLRALLERIDYRAAAVDDPAALAAIAEVVRANTEGDSVYHLSTAPRFYAPLCHHLGALGVAGSGTRVLLEKPIGHDLTSAIAINDGVAEVFDERRVFRVDHYLGKEGVQNLLALRFGNALFEPLWSARHIEQVQITVAETVGVEGRGDYYDHSGAMRDMLQNHLLQLLCLTAMEPPSQFDPSAVRNEKLKVLRSLRAIGRAEVASESVAGQYGAGAIDGAPYLGSQLDARTVNRVLLASDATRGFSAVVSGRFEWTDELASNAYLSRYWLAVPLANQIRGEIRIDRISANLVWTPVEGFKAGIESSVAWAKIALTGRDIAAGLAGRQISTQVFLERSF